MTRSRPGSAGAVLLLAWTSSGCASDQPSAAAERVFVGAVQDSDVMVGIATAGNRTTWFFCGGPTSYATQTHWFSSPSGLGSAFSLSDGGLQLEGASSADTIQGTLQKDAGDARSFSARQVSDAPPAGVYDALAPCGHIGLIVQPSTTGAPPAAQGTCLQTASGADIVEQVNPVMPLSLDANGGVAVSVAGDLDQTFILHPLVPAAGS